MRYVMLLSVTRAGEEEVVGKKGMGEVTVVTVEAGVDMLGDGASGPATFTKAFEGPAVFREIGLGERLARELRQLCKRLGKKLTHVLRAFMQEQFLYLPLRLH